MPTSATALLDGAKLIRCLFTGIGRAHYPQPMLDERGMAVDFHFVVKFTSPRLSGEALIGARFPFCQHKHREG